MVLEEQPVNFSFEMVCPFVKPGSSSTPVGTPSQVSTDMVQPPLTMMVTMMMRSVVDKIICRDSVTVFRIARAKAIAPGSDRDRDDDTSGDDRDRE